jgi:hypothetical protein
MGFTLQELHDEIENDPDGLGYKNLDGTWKSDNTIYNIGNNIDGLTPYVVNRATVPVWKIRSVTTFDAFDGLTAAEADWFAWLTGTDEITPEDHLLADLVGIGGTSRWATGERSQMEAALQPIFQKNNGSRFEKLWGEGVVVSESSIGHAANL